MTSLNMMRELEPGDTATSTPLGPSNRQLAEQAARDAAAKPAAPAPKRFLPSLFTRNSDTPAGREQISKSAWIPSAEPLAADFSKVEKRCVADFFKEYMQCPSSYFTGTATYRRSDASPKLTALHKSLLKP